MRPELVIACAAGAAVAVSLFAFGFRLLRTDPAAGLEPEDLVLLRDVQRKRAEGSGPFSVLGRRLAPHLLKALGDRPREWLVRRIAEAGRPGGMTVETFVERLATWLVLVVPLVLLLLLLEQPLLAMLTLAIPVLMPLGVVEGARRRRREGIDRDLPDFLDILAVTVAAGVNFRAALLRVADRFEGPLAEEVVLTTQQIANGLPLREAFTDLARRSGSDNAQQFVSALLQSQELGAPLVESLNQIAADMRRESAQQQRRRAASTAPRVSLVTSVVLLPGALIFIVVGFIVGADLDLSGLL